MGQQEEKRNDAHDCFNYENIQKWHQNLKRGLFLWLTLFNG